MAFLIRLLVSAVGFFAVIIFTQDMQLFPGAVVASYQRLVEKEAPLTPDGIEPLFIEREDSPPLEVWKLESESTSSPYTALFFHGNGAPLSGFEIFPRWFEALGIKSYGLEYRGYGRDWSWPNENNIQEDVKDFVDYVRQQEGVDSKQIIVMGYSLGGPFAARAARLLSAESLILISTFSSVGEMLDDRDGLATLAPLLRPFLWNPLDVSKELSMLEETKLLMIHGTEDGVIPLRHLELLRSSYVAAKGEERLHLKEIEGADHNDVFIKGHAWIAKTLELGPVPAVRSK